jgi:hypothetical protein
MPSISRSKSLTMSFYTGLAARHDHLTKDKKPSHEAVKICIKEFEVSAQTVSDALLFLKFPEHENKRVYGLYEREFFATSTLIFILKAASRLDRRTDDVIKSLFSHVEIDEQEPTKSIPRRGGKFPLSQTDVKNWMKETTKLKAEDSQD